MLTNAFNVLVQYSTVLNWRIPKRIKSFKMLLVRTSRLDAVRLVLSSGSLRVQAFRQGICYSYTICNREGGRHKLQVQNTSVCDLICPETGTGQPEKRIACTLLQACETIILL